VGPSCAYSQAHEIMRSDSIRTRHLAGVIHGQVRMPGLVVVPADQMVASAPPVITTEEVEARGFLTLDALAAALGVSESTARNNAAMGHYLPVAVVHMRRGTCMRFVRVYDLGVC
jgi:hypothetical protein